MSNFIQYLYISNSLCSIKIFNLVKYRIKDATYGYYGTKYDLFRAWVSEHFMARGHFFNVD